MKRFGSIALIAMILLFASSASADWQDDLQDDPANPIFEAPPGDRVYYPTVLFDADGFGNGDAGPFYRLWYSDGTGIGGATSSDGIAWTDGADCVGLTNPHHATLLYDADGFGDGAAGPFYRIWYWDTAQLYSINAIRTAESDDGITWVNDQVLTQDGAKPIITGGGGDWNRGSYGPVHLIYQPGAANAGVDPFGYEYVMYYDGTTGGLEQVGLGYSVDGLHWVRYGDDPVLACGGAPGDWDEDYAGFGDVVRDADGVFHFWYSGGVASMDEGVGYATSDDGIVWVKDAANPFIALDAGTWHSQRAYTPAVLYDEGRYSGHGQTSQFKLWFAGRDDAGDFHLGYYGDDVAGTVAVVAGPAMPASRRVALDADAIVLMQLALDVDAIEAVTIQEMTIRLGGSAASDKIRQLSLYREGTPDGLLGADDVLIAQEIVAGSAVAFDGFAETIAASSSAIWIVVAEPAANVAADDTIIAALADEADVVGVGAYSGDLVVALAEPLLGPVVIFGETTASASGGDDDDSTAASEAGEGDAPSDGDDAEAPSMDVIAYGSNWSMGGGGCRNQMVPVSSAHRADAIPAWFFLLIALQVLFVMRVRRRASV